MRIQSAYHPLRGTTDKKGNFTPDPNGARLDNTLKVSITFETGESIADLTPERIGKGIEAIAKTVPELNLKPSQWRPSKLTEWDKDGNKGCYVTLVKTLDLQF